MPERKLAFSIDGDWLTEHIRQRYIETRSMEDPLKILACVEGLTAKDALAIIQGSKRLTGVTPKITLVDDNVIVKLPPLPPPRQDDDEDAGDTEETFVELEPPPGAPPKPDTELSAETGMVAPDGKFYACEYGGHVTLERQLGILRYTWRANGYVKLQRGEWFRPDGEVTQAQIDTVFEWHTKRGLRVPSWLTDED